MATQQTTGELWVAADAGHIPRNLFYRVAGKRFTSAEAGLVHLARAVAHWVPSVYLWFRHRRKNQHLQAHVLGNVATLGSLLCHSNRSHRQLLRPITG